MELRTPPTRHTSEGAPYERENQPVRHGLRALGGVLVVVGGIFTLIGLVDFFAAFSGRHGFPTKFWCAFVGIPLFGIGMNCLRAGYLGKINRYVAGESVPVVTESLKHVARELRPEVTEFVRDIKTADAAPAADTAERLKVLEQLRRDGLVTQSEYEEKRRAIIAAL